MIRGSSLGRGEEQRAEEQKAAAEKHGGKKPVLLLTETIAQHADKPQECNPSEQHQIHRQRDRPGTSMQPGARLLWIGRNRDS